MPHATNEVLRKSLHIAFGFGAFALKWLSWEVAAMVCVAAIVSNWLVLHRLVGRGVSRHERGYDEGIVFYPVAVLLLILVFRHQLHFAAIGWALLAFGDGVATLAGKSIRGASTSRPATNPGRASSRSSSSEVRWPSPSRTGWIIASQSWC